MEVKLRASIIILIDIVYLAVGFYLHINKIVGTSVFEIIPITILFVLTYDSLVKLGKAWQNGDT